MIKHETIEQIQDLPIYDVIREYVPELKKAGSSYRACSPFNNDRTPSFYVVPSKNIFKCFSSGKGGSAITFVMEHQNLGFIDTIKDIAGKFGIRIEYEISDKASEEQNEREELFKINMAASRKFAGELFKLKDTDHPAVAELVVKRKFTPDTIAQWQIGYAPGHIDNGYKPDQWKFLTSILHEKALIDPALKLGLVTQKDKLVYDTYRNRIIFPIYDHHNRIVSFGGRALHVDDFNPKYINGKESQLFSKSKVLFGINFAKKAIRKRGSAGLVEGYMDVISLHQAGYNNAVGTCGTALTPEQCQLLKKCGADKVVMFPDPDSAGESSALRNIDLLLKYGIKVSVVPMPKVDGKKIDPDELVRTFEPITEDYQFLQSDPHD